MRRGENGSAGFEAVHKGEVLIGLDHADAMGIGFGDGLQPLLLSRDRPGRGIGVRLVESVESHDCTIGKIDTDKDVIESIL